MTRIYNCTRRTRTFNVEACPERTLTLAALERREVPDAALGCAEVAAALRAGTLRVLSSPQPEPEEPSDTPAADEPPTGRRGRRR